MANRASKGLVRPRSVRWRVKRRVPLLSFAKRVQSRSFTPRLATVLGATLEVCSLPSPTATGHCTEPNPSFIAREPPPVANWASKGSAEVCSLPSPTATGVCTEPNPSLAPDQDDDRAGGFFLFPELSPRSRGRPLPVGLFHQIPSRPPAAT